MKEAIIYILAFLLVYTFISDQMTIHELQYDINQLKNETAPIIKAQKTLEQHIQSNGIDRDRADEISWATILSARAHGIPWQLVAAVIEAESSFKVNAVSPAKCRGLMQLSPDKLQDWKDPYKNVWVGTGYLRQMIDRFGMPRALMAYNAGPNHPRKDIISRGYALRVLEYQKRLEGLK